MWLDNLKELKSRSKMTFEQIAEKSKVPESTVKRIFSGKNEPSASTLYKIVVTMDGSLDDILADTNAIIAHPEIVETKEQLEEVRGVVNVMEAERDIIKIESERLKVENANLLIELKLLKQELQHKDELLELHKFYRKLIPSS